MYGKEGGNIQTGTKCCRPLLAAGGYARHGLLYYDAGVAGWIKEKKIDFDNLENAPAIRSLANRPAAGNSLATAAD